MLSLERGNNTTPTSNLRESHSNTWYLDRTSQGPLRSQTKPHRNRPLGRRRSSRFDSTRCRNAKGRYCSMTSRRHLSRMPRRSRRELKARRRAKTKVLQETPDYAREGSSAHTPPKLSCPRKRVQVRNAPLLCVFCGRLYSPDIEAVGATAAGRIAVFVRRPGARRLCTPRHPPLSSSIRSLEAR
jgi:hypothetical protein